MKTFNHVTLQLEVWLYDDLKKLMIRSHQTNSQGRISLRGYIVGILAQHAKEGMCATLSLPVRPSIPLSLPQKCSCGCCHAVDYGACDAFEEGGNGRCVYCDHSEPCHERDKNRPMFNGPLEPGFRTESGDHR
jgi:hypothetical protein